jgi:hypothetical protein
MIPLHHRVDTQKVGQALPRGDLQRVEKRLFGTPLAIHAKLSPEEMQKILTEIQTQGVDILQEARSTIIAIS